MTENDIRYYKNKIPFSQDILIAKITNISENGVYANSVEYPHLKLFIPLTEISKRKTNVKKLFSPDKLYPVLVLDINIQGNLVDVSYNKISDKDKKIYLERFLSLQKIYKLGLEAAKEYSLFCNIDNNDAQECIFSCTIWNIFDKFIKDKKLSEYINDFYISLLENPLNLFNEFSDNVSISDKFDEYKERFVENIKKRIKISDVVLSVEITLVCLQNSALEKIKKALKVDLDPKVQLRYISSPRYELVATCNNKLLAEQLLKNSVDIIKNNCKNQGVRFINHSDIIVQKEKSYIFNSIFN